MKSCSMEARQGSRIVGEALTCLIGMCALLNMEHGEHNLVMMRTGYSTVIEI